MAVFTVASPVELLIEWLGPQGVVMTLIGSGTLGAIAKMLIDKYLKPKVEKTTLQNIEHERAGRMSLALAERLEGEIKRLDGELGELREELKEERTQRVSLGRKVDQQNRKIYRMSVYIARIADFWKWVSDHWEEIRQRPHPPTMPKYDGELEEVDGWQ